MSLLPSRHDACMGSMAIKFAEKTKNPFLPFPHPRLAKALFSFYLKAGGGIYRCVHTAKMSRRNGNVPKLDLKLNLSPPRGNPHMESPSRSATVSPTSPPTSCVSSENQEDMPQYSNSPEATSMVLVGCPRCLMYVMLSEDDPKCPKCKSTVLLDFLHDNNNNSNNNTRETRRS
ncbi:hypothetical protein CUMW_005100 [Citrus unshiu]|nr:hypothetical protein CUMW_005100 [Citrus unshiu]